MRVIYAETNSASIHIISFSKSANGIYVAKAAATLLNAAIRLHVVFGCATAAFCPVATTKRAATKSATTAAVCTALASFDFAAFLFYSSRFALADFDLDVLYEQNGDNALDDLDGDETRKSSLDEEDTLNSQSEDKESTIKRARIG